MSDTCMIYLLDRLSGHCLVKKYWCNYLLKRITAGLKFVSSGLFHAAIPLYKIFLRLLIYG